MDVAGQGGEGEQGSGGRAALARARAFAAGLGLARPVWQAPMAGVPSIALAAAVAEGGGLASCGALLLPPAGIADWVARFRAAAPPGAPLHLNLWMPDPPPRRDAAHEARVAAWLGGFGPPVPPGAGDGRPPDVAEQIEAVAAARPTVFSSVMGLPEPAWVERLHGAGVRWFATVSSLAEARAAAAAGADGLIVQGAEAGGHRGAFDAASARDAAVGLLALLPAVADAVPLPLVAAGGIADGRTAAAALLLGASAVAPGTALLRCPEAGIAPAWQAALANAAPEGTRLTRVFSGRWGRSLAGEVVLAAASSEAPEPAPYPVQRGLSAAMRQAAEAEGRIGAMQAWAGQSAALSRPAPAAAWVERLWADAEAQFGAAG